LTKTGKKMEMRLRKVLTTLLASLIATTTVAHAEQSDGWEFSGTFYLWAAQSDTTITTPTGSVESSLSFGDAVENLDFAFMGTLEAR
jgi:hypothetical protein